MFEGSKGSLAKIFWKILFLAPMIVSDHSYQCPENYGELKLEGVEDNCQRIENGTDPPWLRITWHHLCNRSCILKCCRDFAFCLKQSVVWREECTRRIVLLWRGRSINTKVESVSNGPSYSLTSKDVTSAQDGQFT